MDKPDIGFQDKMRKYFDEEGFDDIMELVKGLSGDSKLKALMALLPYGTSKFNSTDYGGQATSDLKVELILDKTEDKDEQGEDDNTEKSQ